MSHPNPKFDPVKIQTWLNTLTTGELETLGILIYNTRHVQFREWDKTIASHPFKRKSP